MTTSSAGVPTPAAVPARRPLRVWDLVIAILLTVLNIGLAVLLLVLAPFLVMASDPCGSATRCNLDQMGVGFGIAVIGPVVATALGIAATVVLLALRRLAFWVPLVGAALALGLFALGAALVIGGVPGATF